MASKSRFLLVWNTELNCVLTGITDAVEDKVQLLLSADCLCFMLRVVACCKGGNRQVKLIVLNPVLCLRMTTLKNSLHYVYCLESYARVVMKRELEATTSTLGTSHYVVIISLYLNAFEYGTPY